MQKKRKIMNNSNNKYHSKKNSNTISEKTPKVSNTTTNTNKWQDIDISFKHQIQNTCTTTQFKITTNENNNIFIPKNIMEHIFQFLDYRDFKNIVGVCKKFYLLMTSNKMMIHVMNTIPSGSIPRTILSLPPNKYYRNLASYEKYLAIQHKKKNVFYMTYFLRAIYII